VQARIQVSRDVWSKLLERARCDPKQECCGLLAGRGGAITHMFRAANVAADRATNYEIDPRETVRLMREFRAQQLEFLGIYHSHPNGQNEPSARDIELAFYSEAVYFIVSPLAGAPNPVRAFSIRDGRVMEVEIEIF
jgi:proteasome lid subunit RPN8/RPN11